jgi:hypothetical protein
MTTQLPADVLHGLPAPSRHRWQPLRAGIVGLFRYDQQTFVFHHGRLLLRGNNGSGKSMALEVLLPFVLDAKLAAERLSTFGGRERGMYLWLLGHEADETRTNARGYVWVEFGRLNKDGVAEYCTAGAGMQATRSSKRVTSSWFFTTAARIGVDLEVGVAGGEPLGQAQLDQKLSALDEAGMPGAVHASPDAHRKEVNRVLFGLEDRQFEALRSILLHLRRPKLSDKLSENKLDEILRDSLPPVNTAVTDELADGFERLERHRHVVGELKSARDALSTVARAYAAYLEILTGLRAQEVLGAAKTLDGREAEVKRATGQHEAAGKALQQAQEAKATAESTVRQLTSSIKDIENSEIYRQGGRLVPLREKATELAKSAGKARKHADEARTTAARKEADAVETAELAAEATVRRSARASEADHVATSLPVRDLPTLIEKLLAELTEQGSAPSRVDTAIVRFRTAVADETKRLDNLLDLVRRASKTADEHTTAQRDTAKTKELVSKAEEALTAAQSSRREAVEEFIGQLDVWLDGCAQLSSGAAPPAEWPESDPRAGARAWVREAATGRRAQLSHRRDALGGTRPVIGELRRRVSALAEQLTTFAETLTGLRPLAGATRVARTAFAESVTGWLGRITELPAGKPIPEPLRALDARSLTRVQLLAWVTEAAHARSVELGRQETRAQAEVQATEEVLGQTKAEYDRLVSGGSTAPPKPFTRLADRTGRPGAPFYLLIDFIDNSRPEADLAGLEAALVGAGLADAWVSPDGSLTHGPGGALLVDTQLVVEGPESRSPLASILRPDPALKSADAPVPASVVETLLRRIRLAETAATSASPDEPVVAWDGTWACGGLHGAYHKSRADLIGSASREAHRRRRMAELEANLTILREERRIREAVLGRIRESIRQVELERQTAPDDESIRLADEALNRAVQEFTGSANRLSADAGTLSSAGIQSLVDARTALGEDGFSWTDTENGVADIALVTSTATLTSLTEAAAAAATVWEGQPGPAAADKIEAALIAIQACGAQLDDADQQLGVSLSLCSSAETELEQEITALPPGQRLDEAEGMIKAAETTVSGERTRLGVLRQAENEARQRREDAEHNRAIALELAGLADRAADLPVFKEATEHFRSRGEDWINAAAHATQQNAHASAVRREADNVNTMAGSLTKHANDAEEVAQLAKTSYDELQARMGKPHQEMRKELDLKQNQLSTQEELQQRYRDDELKLTQLLEQRRGELGAKKSERETALTTLAGKAERLADVQRLGLLASLPAFREIELPAFGADALRPDQVELIGSWARLLDQHYRQPSYRVAQLDLAQTKLGRSRSAAEEPLNNLVALRERTEFQIIAVTGARNGRERSLPDAVRHLDEEIAASEQLLETEESHLFEKFLSDEVRLEVGRRIDSADVLLNRANNLMKAHKTSSGFKFKLVWETDPACEMPADMMELLKKPQGTLYQGERNRLSEFFRRRVGVARSRATVVPWREQLAELLDYRRWYKFRLFYQRDAAANWAVLSKKAHGGMSGGEKAIALHMPLFAAAATHCEASRLQVEENGKLSPGCPRLILLDEVFAGVDAENRGVLFDLIRQLDLDLVATSESEQGLYAELDGLSIYHLIADDSLPGVLAVRSVWDGYEEHRMLEHDLARLP